MEAIYVYLDYVKNYKNPANLIKATTQSLIFIKISGEMKIPRKISDFLLVIDFPNKSFNLRAFGFQRTSTISLMTNVCANLI